MLKKCNKKVLNIFKAVIVFGIFLYGAYIFKYIPIFLFNLNISDLTLNDQVLLSLFSSFLLSAIFFVIYKKDLVVEFQKFKDNFVDNMDHGVKWWLIGIAIMMASNLILNFIFNAGGANNEIAVQSMLEVSPYLMLINVGIFAPFNEEIVFRKTLKDCTTNKWIFVLLSFVLFGGAHVIGSANSLLDYFFIIPYGTLGGAFAMAYSETDTVFTSMTFHMIHNTALTLLTIL